VETIADVNATITSITMNDDYSIIANFATAVEIWDWYDLDAVRNNLGGSYILMKDLDSTTAGYEELASPTANSGKGWQPIGFGDVAFTGTFDGQGHEIRDLFISRPYESFVGLFAVVDEGGIVRNIGVVDADVTGKLFVGGLVGVNEHSSPATVSNSYWDTQTSGQLNSAGGIGKNTTEMQDITTFSLAGWNIISVADPGTRDVAYVWNIVNNVTYPFLSWQA
jgi:hypothetical protein